MLWDLPQITLVRDRARMELQTLCTEPSHEAPSLLVTSLLSPGG